MSETNREPVLAFESAASWHAWLAKHYAKSGAVLLRIPKGSGGNGITYPQALDVALAWGWIDSRKLPLDASAWLQRFSPRTPRSPWSRNNREKAEALIAAGAMEPPGLREVEGARADGRWDRAYDGSRASTVPPDLAAAFARNARARAFFESLDSANRYAITYRVQTARKPETRARAVARFVQMCARGETIHPRRTRRKSAGTI